MQSGRSVKCKRMATATVSGVVAAGEAPDTLCKMAHVGPRAGASSVPDSSGELLAPRQLCLGNKAGISGRFGKKTSGDGTTVKHSCQIS